MLTPPADKLATDHVQSLLTDQIPESRTLDYKRDLCLSTGDEKKEFARDVSALANAAGGFLVFGIDEAKGVPSNICGVSCNDFDKLKLSMEQILAAHIQPRVRGVTFGKIDGGFANGPVIAVHVPQSWIGPHMAAERFYSRNSAGKFTLDVDDIRRAFIAGNETAERIRRFRDERLGRIMSGEGPVPIFSDDTKLVVHLCPVGEATTDLKEFAGNPGRLPPLAYSAGWNSRHNLDGYLTYGGPQDGPQHAYSLAFRNGAFEGVATINTFEDGIYAVNIERGVLSGVGRYVGLSRGLGYDGPLTVMVAVTNVYLKRFTRGREYDFGRRARDKIDRSTLILPEVLLEAPKPDLPRELRPIFDALWQSSGWESSPYYGEDGNRLPDGGS